MFSRRLSPPLLRDRAATTLVPYFPALARIDCAATYGNHHNRAKTVASNFKTSAEHHRARIRRRGFHGDGVPAATGDNIADAVLGQIDFSHNGLNNPGAASLDSPGQMAIDASEHLYIVDGNNSRILGWNDATSFSNGQNADIEIGQPDFQTTLCNSGTAGGDLAGLGADSLCLPGGVAVDSVGNL